MIHRTRTPLRHQKPHSEKNGKERWLLTYSDLITLLLIFFVILFAMGSINQAKYREMALSLAHALGTHTSLLHHTSGLLPASHSLLSTPQTTADTLRLNHLYTELNAYIVKHHLQSYVTVTNEVRGVQLTIRDIALFANASAQLNVQAQKLIHGFVPFIQQIPNPVVVEGYTDSRPIHTAQFPSNWELSAARALTVVHLLIHEGVRPSRLSGVAYGPYHAVATNATQQGRQRNRRVNLVFMRTSAVSQMRQALPAKTSKP